MKKYISPAMQVSETTVEKFIAVSLKVSNKTTEDQLTKEATQDWDMWNED